MSKIEWTHRPGTKSEVLNPTTGCDKVSAGCRGCYAEVMHKRLTGMGQPKYQQPFLGGATFWPDELAKPFKWKKPRTVFLNSMSDIFHVDITVQQIAEIYAMMFLTPEHTYIVLTKRAERAYEVLRGAEFWEEFWKACNRLHDKYIKPLEQAMYFEDELRSMWPLRNVWQGVSVENQDQMHRAYHLLKTPAYIRVLSLEPMIGPVDLSEWFNKIYEDEKISRIGTEDTQSRSGWRIGDRQQGSYLEDSETRMGSMVAKDSDEAMQKGEGGDESKLRVSTNKGDVEQRSNLYVSPPISLPSLQRDNSDRNDSESQERKEDGQQTEQLGVSNEQRTTDSCYSHTKSESARSETERRKESHGGTDEGGHQKYSEAKIKRGEIEVDSGIVRNSISARVKNLPRLQMGSRFWIIQGGESGHSARPAHLDWFRTVRDQCKAAGVSFFFKQMGQWKTAGLHSPGEPGDFAIVHPDGKHATTDQYPRQFALFGGGIVMEKSKDKSGNYLDGVQHLEFPA